jgi:predicted extracellular nuclease
VPVFDYNDTVRDPGEATFEAEPTGNPLYEPNAVRTSDHDPVIVDVNLCPSSPGTPRSLCLAKNLLLKLACALPRL